MNLGERETPSGRNTKDLANWPDDTLPVLLILVLQ